MRSTWRQNPLFIIMIIFAFWQLLGGGGRIGLLMQSPITFAMLIISILLAITVHEFFHALTTDRLGDPTPRLAGRVTLNPLKHLDPIGTLMILFTNFGWGRPVEFDPYNLRRPRQDAAIIAVFGPISNLLMAGIAALIVWIVNAHLLPMVATTHTAWLEPTLILVSFLYIFGSLNITLAIFNLIPIRPLDGSHILRALLPTASVASFDRFMRRFGLILLFLFIFPIFGQSAPINYVLTPIVSFLTNLLFPLF